jgi:hypothetical protein
MVRVFGSGKQKRTATNKSDTMPAQQSELVVELLKEQLKQSAEREQFYKAEIANIRKDFEDYKLLIGMKNTPENTSPADVSQEQSEQRPLQENDTIQTGQGEQRNDNVTRTENNAPKTKRGLFGRVFSAVFEGE